MWIGISSSQWERRSPMNTKWRFSENALNHWKRHWKAWRKKKTTIKYIICSAFPFFGVCSRVFVFRLATLSRNVERFPADGRKVSQSNRPSQRTARSVRIHRFFLVDTSKWMTSFPSQFEITASLFCVRISVTVNTKRAQCFVHCALVEKVLVEFSQNGASQSSLYF